jgi:hypothetical protein
MSKLNAHHLFDACGGLCHGERLGAVQEDSVWNDLGTNRRGRHSATPYFRDKCGRHADFSHFPCCRSIRIFRGCSEKKSREHPKFRSCRPSLTSQRRLQTLSIVPIMTCNEERHLQRLLLIPPGIAVRRIVGPQNHPHRVPHCLLYTRRQRRASTPGEHRPGRSLPPYAPSTIVAGRSMFPNLLVLTLLGVDRVVTVHGVTLPDDGAAVFARLNHSSVSRQQLADFGCNDQSSPKNLLGIQNAQGLKEVIG